MAPMPHHKYRPYPPVALTDRSWPSRSLERAPRWCSVDLRDGNQALIEPMGPQRKRRLFETLVRLGFKEIEVGFPAASQPDFDFVRELIDQRSIPPNVTIAVLTQARDELIERTFEAIAGAERAIVHVYNSTSTLQRRVVFGLEPAGVVAIATRATALIKALAAGTRTRITLQYSPESFTGTELPFAREICEAVMDVWQPAPSRKMILNLPATVEMATPNVYADQIEWFGRHAARRDAFVLSVHPHNDRGTAVAAAELAMLAGAERVEGCLFGNGERTGNVDIVTLALNLFSQGIDPELDLSDVPGIVATAEYCTRLPVGERHPYAGELVFTAFSGSHQDAIKKGLAAREARGDAVWEVPYLPVDPADLGRSYEAVVRINSQSGKGGVAYILESDAGYVLPRALQIEFAQSVQIVTEETGGEIAPAQIVSAFEAEYVDIAFPFSLIDHRATGDEGGRVTLDATLGDGNALRAMCGSGNGPIDAFVAALRRELGMDVGVREYHEHAAGAGSSAIAIAYVEIELAQRTYRGVGRDANIVTATLRAVLSAVNRGLRSADSRYDDAGIREVERAEIAR